MLIIGFVTGVLVIGGLTWIWLRVHGGAPLLFDIPADGTSWHVTTMERGSACNVCGRPSWDRWPHRTHANGGWVVKSVLGGSEVVEYWEPPKVAELSDADEDPSIAFDRRLRDLGYADQTEEERAKNMLEKEAR